MHRDAVLPLPRAFGVIALLAVFASLAHAGSASADPLVDQKKAQYQHVHAEVRRLDSRVEILTERYDGAVVAFCEDLDAAVQSPHLGMHVLVLRLLLVDKWVRRGGPGMRQRGEDREQCDDPERPRQRENGIPVHLSRVGSSGPKLEPEGDAGTAERLKVAGPHADKLTHADHRCMPQLRQAEAPSLDLPDLSRPRATRA